MKFVRFSILFLLITLFYSQPVLSDSDKPQTQPSDSDVNQLVEKYLKDIEIYVNDSEDCEDYDQEELLEDNYYKARWELIKLGDKAVPQLVSLLKTIRVYRWDYDKDDSEREDYEEFLFELLPEILGKIGAPAYPYVLEMLKDKDLYIRKYALHILENNREVPLSMLNPILQSAAYDFENFFKRMSEYYEEEYKLKYEDGFITDEVEDLIFFDISSACSRIYDLKPVHYVEALQDENIFVRMVTIFELWQLSYSVKFDDVTHDAVRKALNDKIPNVRHYAVDCLDYLNDDKDVPYFLSALTDKCDDVVYDAVNALYQYNSDIVIDAMLKLLNYDDAYIRMNVVEYFIKNSTSIAVPELIKNLTLKNASEKFLDAVSDAIVNCAGKTYQSDLMKLLDSENQFTVTTGIKALSKIGVESIKDQVLKLKDDEDANIREAVVTWITSFPSKDYKDYLLKSIKDNSEKVRAQAVLALANIDDEIVKPALLNAINDESVIVKKNVCIAANLLNAHEFSLSIENILFSDDIEIYRFDDMFHIVVNTLIKFKDTKVLPTLGKVFADHSCYYEDEDFIKEKIQEVFSNPNYDKAKVSEGMYELLKIVAVSDHEAKTEFILEFLKDDKSAKFLQALNNALLTSSNDSAELILTEISEFAGKSSFDFLIKFSETASLNYEYGLRSLLADTIRKIIDKSYVPKLFDILKAGNTRIKTEVMEIICELGGKEYIASILELMDSKLPWVRIVAVNGYSVLADNPIPKLQELFESNDNFSVKIYIAGNIIKYAKTETKKYEEYIVSLLNNDDFDCDTMEMVNLLKIESLTPHLLNLLKTHDSWFIDEVIHALGFKGNTAAVPTLCKILLDYHHVSVRYAIAYKLSVIGDKKAIPTLIESMKTDYNLDVRAECAESLGNLGDTSAVPALIEALDDKEEPIIWCCCEGCEIVHDDNVQEAAIIALGKLGDARALPRLKQLVKEVSYEYIQKILTEAIKSIESKAKPE